MPMGFPSSSTGSTVTGRGYCTSIDFHHIRDEVFTAFGGRREDKTEYYI